MNSRFSICLLASVVTSILLNSAFAQSTSYFRQDSGVAADDKHALPQEFGDDQQVWRQPILPGQSTPCVIGDAIFLTTFDKEAEELATVALDRATGKLRWKQVAPAKKIEEFHRTGSPAVCTPACDGERVYVFFGSYGALCYDLEGKLLWKKPMGPFQDEFGASSSPILVDNKVILNEDHDVDSFIIALNKETGDTEWKTSREGFTRSYSTPVVMNVAGRKQVVVAGALQLAAYDVTNGEKLWWVNGLSRILDTTPAVIDGIVYVSTWTPGGDELNRISMQPYPEARKQFDKNDDGLIGKNELPEGPVLTRFFRIDLNQDQKLNETEWNKHARVFELAQNVTMAVRPNGKGDLTKDGVQWIARRGMPTVPSPVVYRDVVYMIKDGGIITSLDAKSGEILKQGRSHGRGNYYASAVAGDGKVYFTSEGGVITVLNASGEWEVASSHNFGERIMATPVIADGKMYIRTGKAVYCFEKK